MKKTIGNIILSLIDAREYTPIWWTLRGLAGLLIILGAYSWIIILSIFA